MKQIILKPVAALLLLLPVAFASCKEENEDLTQEPGKDGSVETAVAIQHLDSTRDLLVTTHKVWVKGSIVRQVSYTDTLPSLGMTRQEGENGDGEQASIEVPKEYEVYITVK